MATTDAGSIVNSLGYRPFDADNHYYEALDAFNGKVRNEIPVVFAGSFGLCGIRWSHANPHLQLI